MKVMLRRLALFWQLLIAFGLLIAIALVLSPSAFAQTGDGDVIDPQTDLGMWSLLVGVAMPALVAVIEQTGWSRTLRVFIGLAASAVAAFVTTWLVEGDALWNQGMFHAFLLIAVASWASYQSFWKPSNIAPRIERATSFGGSSAGPPG